MDIGCTNHWLPPFRSQFICIWRGAGAWAPLTCLLSLLSKVDLFNIYFYSGPVDLISFEDVIGFETFTASALFLR